MEASHQVIVACTVINEARDALHLLRLAPACRRPPHRPRRVLADAGSQSEENVTRLTTAKIEPFIASGKVKPGTAPPPPPGRTPKEMSLRDRMRHLPPSNGTTCCVPDGRNSRGPSSASSKLAQSFR
jgi:hypothetical protein